MIKNYAGFATDLEDEALIDYLIKERASVRRLVLAYNRKSMELTECIDSIKMEMRLK